MPFASQASRLCLIVFGAFSAVSAKAVPTIYEFGGYVASVQSISTAGPLQPLTPALPVFGSITFDPERAAPLVSFELHHGSNVLAAQSQTGSIAVQDNPWHESLTVQGGFTYRAGTPEASAVAISLDWGSPLGNQLEPNLSTLNLATLVPGHFSLKMRSQPASCAPSCAGQHVVTIHIASLWYEGGSAHTEYSQQFSTLPNAWASSGGSWGVDSGAYINQANVALTTSLYRGVYTEEAFDITTRAYSQWGGAGNTLGLVFNYFDAKNFYELRVNALGSATLSRIANGARTTLGTATVNTGQGRWFTLRVYRDFMQNSLQVWVDGASVFNLTEPGTEGGHAGVFASWNRARFDEFSISVARERDREYSSFTEDACGWEPVKGQWTAQNGYYRSSTNQPHTAAVTIGGQGEYAISASVYGEWTGPGNMAGLIYDYVDADNYRVVYVPPTCDTQGTSGGVIWFQDFVDGKGRSWQSSHCTTPPAPAGRWSPITLLRHGDATVLFTQGGVYSLKQPEVKGPVRSGLASKFNLSRFDDAIVFTRLGNRACR